MPPVKDSSREILKKYVTETYMIKFTRKEVLCLYLPSFNFCNEEKERGNKNIQYWIL